MYHKPDNLGIIALHPEDKQIYVRYDTLWIQSTKNVDDK